MNQHGFVLVASALLGAPVAPAAPPAWVAQSNHYTQGMLDVLARFNPEFASQLGLPGYDTQTIDLAPDASERSRAALTKVRDGLQRDLQRETDANVHQDLAIMMTAADRFIASSRLREQYLLPNTDVGQTIFQGEFVLLQDQVAPARRPHALARLRCYVGLVAGCTPAT